MNGIPARRLMNEAAEPTASDLCRGLVWHCCFNYMTAGTFYSAVGIYERQARRNANGTAEIGHVCVCVWQHKDNTETPQDI